MSSMVTIRSPGAVRPSTVLRSDVLPDEVGSAHDDVAPSGDGDIEHGADGLTTERIEWQRPVAEAAHAEAGAVGGDRGDHGAHPRPIREPGVDDRRRAVEAASERGEDPFDDDGEVRRRQVTAAIEVTVALDPDVAVGVDEDLVDRLVGEQGVERAEAVEAGDRGAHEPFAVGGADERSDAAEVGAHDGVGVAVVGLGGAAQLGHELLVDAHGDAHWCTIAVRRVRSASTSSQGAVTLIARTRSSCRTPQFPGQQPGEPGGEQSAVDGAGDGRVVADRGHDRRADRRARRRTARSDRPGSTTSTTPSGRHGTAAARRRAR